MATLNSNNNGSYSIPKWFVAVNVAVVTMLAPAIPTMASWMWRIASRQEVNTYNLNAVRETVLSYSKIVAGTREDIIRLDHVRAMVHDMESRVRLLERTPAAQQEIDVIKKRLERIESKLQL